MKILKHVVWKKKITCKSCTSELEVYTSDVKHQQTGCQEDGYKQEYYIECAVCEEYIPLTKLPDTIKYAAWKRCKK